MRTFELGLAVLLTSGISVIVACSADEGADGGKEPALVEDVGVAADVGTTTAEDIAVDAAVRDSEDVDDTAGSSSGGSSSGSSGASGSSGGVDIGTSPKDIETGGGDVGSQDVAASPDSGAADSATTPLDAQTVVTDAGAGSVDVGASVDSATAGNDAAAVDGGADAGSSSGAADTHGGGGFSFDGMTYDGMTGFDGQMGDVVTGPGSLKPCTEGVADACPKGEYCKAEKCGGAGKCSSTAGPQCPEKPDFVCGCDGNTYSSYCEAHKKMMTVAKKGECGALCGGPNKIACKAGEGCDRTGCNADAIGQCIKVAAPCPKLGPSAQQCGCDGKTYAGACERLIAGVAKLYDGPCKAGGACTVGQGGSCPAGAFCEAAVGTCGKSGTCVKQPTSCNNDYKPQCGCDGKTYNNPCERKKSGASLKKDDVCPKVGGSQGDKCVTGVAGSCQQGLYCAGQKCSGDKGICASKPPKCGDYEDPHCGCDGKTYKNPCLVALAGVNLLHKGKCSGGAGGSKKQGASCAIGKKECSSGLWCSGGCAGTGTCQPKPATCGNDYKPVCDCNNQTHSNKCSANFEGVNVKSTGMCPVVDGSACKVNQSFCGQGQYYCKTTLGLCADGSAGKCTKIPHKTCPQTYDYVCGCDGQTYANPCQADNKGVNIKKKGKC